MGWNLLLHWNFGFQVSHLFPPPYFFRFYACRKYKPFSHHKIKIPGKTQEPLYVAVDILVPFPQQYRIEINRL